MMTDNDCVFCGLLSGRLESSLVFTDGHFMAVMAIRPEHVGHVLLFPTAHVEDLAELDQRMCGRLLGLAGQLKSAMAEAIPSQGFQLIINEGKATGQRENCRHLHVHLIPRSLGVGRNERPADAPRAELDATAREIGRRLQGM